MTAAAQGELGEDPEAVAAFRVLTCRGGFRSGESRRAAFHRVIGLAGGYAWPGRLWARLLL